MNRLMQCFSGKILPMWDRHNIEPVGFWNVSVGKPMPRLNYLLCWDNLAARQERWDAFISDSAWDDVAPEDRLAEGGSGINVITSSILKPVEGGPLPRRGNQPARLTGGVFELRTYSFRDTLDLSNAITIMGEHLLAQFAKHGFAIMGLWTTYIGVAPRFTYMLVFQSFAHREQAWAGFYTDPVWTAVQPMLNPGGRPLIENIENCLMKGTPFSGWR